MERYKNYYFPLICLCFVCLAVRHVGKNELVYWGGDESRHFMNGVFIKDFVAEGMWRYPLEYLKWYYLKYPALSLHQYPPLFYLLEAFIFSLFGIHVLAVQAVIVVVLGLGLYAWYMYIKRKWNPEVALLSVVILITAKLFLNNFARIMSDGISLAIILMFIFYLDRWQYSKERKHLFISLVLLVVLLGIAFKTYFILFYFLGCLVYQRISEKSAKIQWTYCTLFFLVIFAIFFTFGTIAQTTKIPLLYRTMQGVNMMSVYKVKRLIQSQSFEYFFRLKLLRMFGVSTILLTAIGVAYIIRNKDGKKISHDVLYAINFLFIFLFCVTHFEPGRFNLFLLPVFSLLSGYAIYNIITRLKGGAVHIVVLCVALVYMGKGIVFSPFTFQGYENAARELIALNQENHPILCDAYLDGNFIVYIRKFDPLKQQIVFRGDKILYSSNVYYRYIQNIYVENEKDIFSFLDLYSIRYVVVDGLFLNIKPKALLRNTLQNPEKFRHINTYPVSTNRAFYEEAALDIYEYIDYKTDYTQEINISLPVMKVLYSFTIDDLKQPIKLGKQTL